MVLPNWLKIAWWVGILGVLSSLLWWRKADLLAGKGTAFDIIAFVLWVSLMLVPIFSEIKIFGFEFSQKIDELEKHIDKQVATLSAEVRNTVDLRTHINPQFNFATPPPDSQLPQLEKSIREMLKQELAALGVTPTAAKYDDNLLPDEHSLYLYSVRRALEIELRRICLQKFGDEGSCSRLAVHTLLNSIQKQKLLSRELIKAIGDVYSVCSASVHGQPATQEQIIFVKDVSPGLLAALKAV
jgi:hypothetical protein